MTYYPYCNNGKEESQLDTTITVNW